MLCTLWSGWRIDQPCVFWMSSSISGLGSLSKIPSNPSIFPTSSLFTNMDHLFWRVSPLMDDHQFSWILLYILKGRNNKIFSNPNMDPRDTLKLAEIESILWAEAQVLNGNRIVSQGRGYDSPINPRVMVFYRWFLEVEWDFLRTRVSEYFRRI